MKIGLYLAYPPSARKNSLKQEGLGRYLSYLTKALLNNGHTITIACPKWSISSINELLEEADIDKHDIKFLLPKSEPIFYCLYSKLVNKKPKNARVKEKGLTLAAFKFVDKIIIGILSTKNVLIFSFFMILMLIVGLVLLPIVLILGILLGVALGINIITRKILRKTVPHYSMEYVLNKLIAKSRRFAKIYGYFYDTYNADILKEKMRFNSAKDIIRRIKYLADTPDLWYCPMAFWPEFNKIDAIKILCIPDLVTTEFPINFSSGHNSRVTDAIRETIDGADYFITYCDYIKKSLAMGKFGKKSDDVISIPHAVNNTLDFINIKKSFNRKEFTYDVNEYFARDIVLRSIVQNANYMQDYLQTGYSFNDVRYIFYSSQVRSNKNILNLVKAYEYLLRVKFVPIKLFLTCNLEADQALKKYIYDNRLQYDVLCFYSVNNQQLAALYKCAELIVNPTLYEGGFPFTFGEGMSVGTPSIMSNIPQITEVTQGFETNNYLFDPYDYVDIADKIVYGLENRDELIKKQMPLYEKVAARTWEDVGKEYVQAFEYFINKDSKNKVK